MTGGAETSERRAAGQPEAPPRASEQAIDAVVTHHADGFRSGVARFNELLAQGLGVPLLRLDDDSFAERPRPLLSFKFSELGEAEARRIEAALARGDWRPDLYLHDFGGLELERRVVTRARRVHCGNLEIAERVRGLSDDVDTLWTPGLILDARRFRPAEVSVFSFGMAHKIRAGMFRQLRELLEASGQTYAVFVSAANHETASLADAQVVLEEMREIFPQGLYFLGNLSDVAVFNNLQQTTFFAAFFERGVRANNTSVASAMERGAVVITNLDEYSPPELVHMDNVIDLSRCSELPSDPLVLKRLSLRAMETGRERSWERLVERLQTGGGR